ncbi:hypothetical protein ACFYUD_03715 [Nocardia tengchongensis]|uniref:hypothetical protein n=1 Tax=Nocardia tengchongensis TaxID=2055889 RepID=UPI0036B38667
MRVPPSPIGATRCPNSWCEAPEGHWQVDACWGRGSRVALNLLINQDPAITPVVDVAAHSPDGAALAVNVEVGTAAFLVEFQTTADEARLIARHLLATADLIDPPAGGAQ